jgi:hypothetical protein
MDISQSERPLEPTLITPECGAPGCHISGDQYEMVRCRGCGKWFCAGHIAPQGSVALVCLAPAAQESLAYYEGVCPTCLQGDRQSLH